MPAAASKRKPFPTCLKDKAPDVTAVHAMLGLKIRSRLKLVARTREPSAVSVVWIACPSFSQLTTASRLPAHRRNSPPFAYGNQRHWEAAATSRLSAPKAIRARDDGDVPEYFADGEEDTMVLRLSPEEAQSAFSPVDSDEE